MNRVKVLEMIAINMERDAAHFDGEPFNGKTIAQYNGRQGAAIATLAEIVKSILEERDESNSKID